MTTIKEMVQEYTNQELAQKWSNNIPLREVENLEFFCTDSQDIEFICDYFSFLPYSRTKNEQDNTIEFSSDITGYVASYKDGDFREIYVTESSRPYDLLSIYHPLEYYL